MLRNRPVRVVTGKIGLDGHDRGIKVVTHALRDAGFAVEYLGMRLGIEQLADAVVEQDIDVLAVNFSGADHLVLVPRLIAAVRERGRTSDDLLLILGGIIPDDDVPKLKELGVADVFLPGTPLSNIVDYIRLHAPDRLS